MPFQTRASGAGPTPENPTAMQKSWDTQETLDKFEREVSSAVVALSAPGSGAHREPSQPSCGPVPTATQKDLDRQEVPPTTSFPSTDCVGATVQEAAVVGLSIEATEVVELVAGFAWVLPAPECEGDPAHAEIPQLAANRTRTKRKRRSITPFLHRKRICLAFPETLKWKPSACLAPTSGLPFRDR